jgi:hypothetical protein
MNTVAITFDEIERSTEYTLGHAFLAKAAVTGLPLWLWYRLFMLTSGLDIVVRVLTPEFIQRLNSEQAETMSTQLRQLHRLMHQLGTSEPIQKAQTDFFLGPRINRLQDRAEAVSDILDNFVLIHNTRLKRLIEDCATAVEA